MKLRGWYWAWIVAALVAMPAASANQMFIAMGLGRSSCGEFLKSADAERKRRPATARSTDIYDINYAAFESYADGFLSGSNYSDPDEENVGENSDDNGRMAWLENYCRNHPLDTYIKALIELRKFLLK